MLTRALGWQTKAHAMKLAAQAVGDGLPTSSPPLPRQAPVDTVRDLLEYFVARQEDRGDIAADTKRNAKRAGIWLTKTIGLVRLDRLSVSDLEYHKDVRMRERMTDKWNRDRGTASPVTIAFELRLLSQAWAWGRAIGLAPNRDVPTITFPVKPKRDKRTPSPADVAAAIAVMRPRYRLVVTLMWCTGARVGEVLALRWEDVDLELGLVELDGKTGPRTVPLAKPALELLKSVPEGARQGPLLGVARASVTSAIVDACDAAKVKRWSPHGLRRLAVDEMQRAGVDVGTAAAVTGHTAVTMLRFYRQPTATDKALAVKMARLGYAPEGKVIAMRKGGEE
jgi:integrase